ncbi:unnamed protein product, partial [Discosporangium mesarthrocarpum]
MMDGPTISKSTAYSVLHGTLEATNSCPDLAIAWPDDDRLDHVAVGLGHAAGKASWTAAPDVCLITLCITLPIVAVRVKAICSARYIFTAACISCPGNTNERTAWNMSNVKSKVEMLPDRYYIIGDTGYPPSDHAFNFFHSQARIPVDQAFDILVMTWGILWKPLRVSLHNTGRIVHACMRLHNFNRKRRM